MSVTLGVGVAADCTGEVGEVEADGDRDDTASWSLLLLVTRESVAAASPSSRLRLPLSLVFVLVPSLLPLPTGAGRPKSFRNALDVAQPAFLALLLNDLMAAIAVDDLLPKRWDALCFSFLFSQTRRRGPAFNLVISPLSCRYLRIPCKACCSLWDQDSLRLAGSPVRCVPIRTSSALNLGSCFSESRQNIAPFFRLRVTKCILFLNLTSSSSDLPI